MKHLISLSFLFILLGCHPSSNNGPTTSTPSNPIDTNEIVEIGGIRQFFQIRGKQDTLPLLLYLHGGPGQAVSQHSAVLTSELEKHFIVVHWDQRKSGKTKDLNENSEAPTLKQLYSDSEAVLNYLLKRFDRQKVTLVGHSWGTILGFHLASTYPQQINQLVAISPPVNTLKSNQIALKLLQNHFTKNNDTKAIQQLSAIEIPHQNLEQKIIQYRWQTVYNGENVTDKQLEKAMPFFEQWEKDWGALAKETESIDFNLLYPTLKCPVYFFVGRKDYQTNFELTATYFKQLSAPLKDLFWFEKSAHNVPRTEPELMQKRIIDIALQ